MAKFNSLSAELKGPKFEFWYSKSNLGPASIYDVTVFPVFFYSIRYSSMSWKYWEESGLNQPLLFPLSPFLTEKFSQDFSTSLAHYATDDFAAMV